MNTSTSRAGFATSSQTPFAGTSFYYYANKSVDTTAPSVLSIGPADGATGVGINVSVRVTFSEAIDPLSVTSDGVTLATPAGPVPVTFVFGPNNTSLRIVPQSPLPANTVITLTLDPLGDAAGNAVSLTTSRFTTGTAADTSAPYIATTNVLYNQSAVPVNSVFVLVFNEPMDVPTVLAQAGSLLYDSGFNVYVAGTFTASPDGRTFTFAPTAPLAVNRLLYFNFAGGLDLAGNPMSGFFLQFSTDFAADTTAPAVVGVNPVD